MKLIRHKENEHRLHKALEKVSLLAIKLDHQGKIKFCNEAFVKGTGYKRDQVLGKSWEEVLTKEKDFRNGAEFFRLNEKGDLITRLKRKIFHSEGNLRNIRFNILFKESSREDGETILVGEDISKKKAVIKALKESNEQLQDLFENANDLIQIFSQGLEKNPGIYR